MPTCVICESPFVEWSYSSPPEPCDCGVCEAASHVETDEQRQRVIEWRRLWKEDPERFLQLEQENRL